MPTRLPDDRTPGQIGDKVADVLWGYYGQQGIPGTPLTPATAQAAPSTVYDDAYADTLLAEPAAISAPVVSPVVAQPAPVAQVSLVIAPTLPVVPATPRYQVFERIRPFAPKAPVHVLVPVAAPTLPVSVQAQVPARVQAPVPAPLPVQRPHVVQLGFVDGTTVELPGEHPAAKALRSAAAALTMRVESSR